MENCLFCAIIEGRLPAERVYENDKAIAFLDIHPRAPGHTVIIPRVHAATIVDLPAGEIEGLFLVVQKVAGALGRGLSTPGLTIGINQDKVGGQEVAHLHVHLMPRFLNDGGNSVQSLVNNQPTETILQIGQKIRSHIESL